MNPYDIVKRPLVSEKTGHERVYRITDKPTPPKRKGRKAG